MAIGPVDLAGNQVYWLYVNLYLLLNLFSSVSFFIYGVACLKSAYMKLEFERYGLPNYRMLVGGLELAGAAGLLVGMSLPLIGCLAAGGLAMLMLMGFAVRIKIRDGWLKSSPALAYMLLNSYLTYLYTILIAG